MMKTLPTFTMPKLAVFGAFSALMFTQQACAVLPTPEPAAALSTSNMQGFTNTVQAMVVTKNESGQEVLVPAPADAKLPAGSIVEYQGLFTNNNQDFATSMMATMSIPKGVELADIQSITPEFPKGSIDGQRFSAMPLRSRVNGQLQPIANSYYRAIRWDVQNLAKGETVKVSYRAIVK